MCMSSWKWVSVRTITLNLHNLFSWLLLKIDMIDTANKSAEVVLTKKIVFSSLSPMWHCVLVQTLKKKMFHFTMFDCAPSNLTSHGQDCTCNLFSVCSILCPLLLCVRQQLLFLLQSSLMAKLGFSWSQHAFCCSSQPSHWFKWHLCIKMMSKLQFSWIQDVFSCSW